MGSQEDLVEVSMFVGPGPQWSQRMGAPFGHTECGETGLNNNRAGRYYVGSLLLGGILFTGRNRRGLYPMSCKACRKRALSQGSAVHLAFNQRPLGLLSETFDEGPIIIAYTVEKVGQFKESLNKTTETITKLLFKGQRCGCSVSREETLTPFP